MKGLSQALALVAGLLLAACQGDLPDNPPKTDSGTPNDPYAPCTDPMKCCSQEKLVCVGDPDGKIVCGCSDLWDCSKNPKKCEQDFPVPPGGSGWECTWTEFKYTCVMKSPNGPGEPPGGGEWTCKWNDKEFQWECTSTPPNPSNQPEGTSVWQCSIVDKKLVCEKKGTTSTPPAGSGIWKCTKDASGREICQKEDENGGLPPGGSNWKCNQTTIDGVVTWVCVGQSEGNPGGNGWNCTKMDEFNTWKCEKPQQSGDIPPGGGWFACTKGSEFGGTQCEKVPEEPTPPTATPKPGDLCIVGEKLWCDGLQYCGWGQVQCDPATGKWKTKIINGKEVLDCQELASGERPNTVCACYHFFFNPTCCERPDCIVPTDSKGQICPASAGQLCDYCSPMAQPSECKESGAKCIVTNNHETFCGRLCDASKPCPNDYMCMTVKLQVGTTNQCVPADFSCYY